MNKYIRKIVDMNTGIDKKSSKDKVVAPVDVNLPFKHVVFKFFDYYATELMVELECDTCKAVMPICYTEAYRKDKSAFKRVNVVIDKHLAKNCTPPKVKPIRRASIS